MAGFQNGAEREFASHLPLEWRGDVKCSKKCFLIFLLSLPHVSFLIHHFFIKIKESVSSFIKCNKEIMPSKWQEHHPILFIDSSVI